jgi:aryl-phospho-beta-D-glucosidase BglC (GH1 family)
MQDPGETKFTEDHKAMIDDFMGRLNTTFVQGKGMPVIIGEYGATNKNNLADRVAWFSYYVGKAKSYGMVTVFGTTETIWYRARESTASFTVSITEPREPGTSPRSFRRSSTLRSSQRAGNRTA